MCVGIGIGSHVDFVVAVLNAWNNFQITHGKTGIKSDVCFRVTYLIVESIENDILSLLLDDLFVSLLTHWMVDEWWAFNVLDGLDFEFW